MEFKLDKELSDKLDNLFSKIGQTADDFYKMQLGQVRIDKWFSLLYSTLFFVTAITTGILLFLSVKNHWFYADVKTFSWAGHSGNSYEITAFGMLVNLVLFIFLLIGGYNFFTNFKDFVSKHKNENLSALNYTINALKDYIKKG